MQKIYIHKLNLKTFVNTCLSLLNKVSSVVLNQGQVLIFKISFYGGPRLHFRYNIASVLISGESTDKQLGRDLLAIKTQSD